jgi:hypothetical protein
MYASIESRKMRFDAIISYATPAGSKSESSSALWYWQRVSECGKAAPSPRRTGSCHRRWCVILHQAMYTSGTHTKGFNHPTPGLLQRALPVPRFLWHFDVRILHAFLDLRVQLIVVDRLGNLTLLDAKDRLNERDYAGCSFSSALHCP